MAVLSPQRPSMGLRQPHSLWHRRVIAAVSVLTAVWLAAQMFTGLSMDVHTWPVAAFPMFSQKRTWTVERHLEIRTRGGTAAAVGPQDFGLTDLQLRNFQRGIVTDDGIVRPQAEDRLGRLAAAWSRGHPDDPAVSMTLTNLVLPMRPASPPVSRQVVRWTAP
jgi:hypothetical protein